MPKNKDVEVAPTLEITFKGGEYKPKKLPSGFIGIKAPFSVLLKEGQSTTFDFQMSCSHPLLVDEGDHVKLVPPGTNIVVTVTNKTAHDMIRDVGEVIARALPLEIPKYEIL